jgi:acyl CoA:acetate/3-ketoacid CoA transferase beta subunit
MTLDLDSVWSPTGQNRTIIIIIITNRDGYPKLNNENTNKHKINHVHYLTISVNCALELQRYTNNLLSNTTATVQISAILYLTSGHFLFRIILYAASKVKCDAFNSFCK